MDLTSRLRPAAALAAGLLLASAALAGQTAVRCGRTYQDRPCIGFDGKLVAPTQAQKKVSANQIIDPACKKRGATALRFIAARAEGASEDAQLASTTSPTEKCRARRPSSATRWRRPAWPSDSAWRAAPADRVSPDDCPRQPP